MGKVYDLVPPGGMQGRRLYVACRFPDGAPVFAEQQLSLSQRKQPAAAHQQQHGTRWGRNCLLLAGYWAHMHCPAPHAAPLCFCVFVYVCHLRA
jgi:hypothetical protein